MSPELKDEVMRSLCPFMHLSLGDVQFATIDGENVSYAWNLDGEEHELYRTKKRIVGYRFDRETNTFHVTTKLIRAVVIGRTINCTVPLGGKL